MADEKIKEAIEKAESSVAIEAGPNDSEGLALIKEALEKVRNNGSFFNELVKLYQERTELKDEDEEIKHGKL